MVTKSKKNKPAAAWWSFAIGMFIIVFFALFLLSSSADIYEARHHWEGVFQKDITKTTLFKENIMEKFELMAGYLTTGEVIIPQDEESEADGNTAIAENRSIEEVLAQEGDNLLYFGLNQATGRVLSNLSSDLDINSLPEGYSYAFVYSEGEFYLKKGEEPVVQLERGGGVHSDYRGYLGRFQGNAGEEQYPGISDCTIYLLVRDQLVANPYGTSSLYQISQDFFIARITFWAFVGILAFGILLLLSSIMHWKQKLEFDRRIGKNFGNMWFEWKIFLTFLIFSLGIALAIESAWYWPFPIGTATAIICYFGLGLWIYALICDIACNRSRFFTNNSIMWAIGFFREKERLKPFQQVLTRRLKDFVIWQVVFMALICFFAMQGGAGPVFAFLLLLAGVVMALLYVRQQKRWIRDLGNIADAIAQIKQGEQNIMLDLDADADLYFLAQDVKSIQEGAKAAAEELLKSERLKIDLVTNISHDLKTPLTSIISYVDLLEQEEGLPEHVNDYIRILVQKSSRLKALIDDLFSLAKATSKNLEIRREKLDFCRLVRQVLGNLEEDILRAGLHVKVNIPAISLFIESDGGRLCRVLENLLMNALKYSLKGSRIFLDVGAAGDVVVFRLKNTANYEMDFDEEEVLQRFVRGDKTRSTEGSGLGLAIAKSFTEACGGTFQVFIDGDQFKAEVTLPRLPEKVAINLSVREVQEEEVVEKNKVAEVQAAGEQNDVVGTTENKATVPQTTTETLEEDPLHQAIHLARILPEEVKEP